MKLEILMTEKHGYYMVRLAYDLEGEDIRFKVHVQHPSSEWVHRYHCGSFRKAMEFIDGPLMEEFSKGG